MRKMLLGKKVAILGNSWVPGTLGTSLAPWLSLLVINEEVFPGFFTLLIGVPQLEW